MDNVRLWEQLNASRENQIKMQAKLQKILMFIYEVYVVRNLQNRRALEGEETRAAEYVKCSPLFC